MVGDGLELGVARALAKSPEPGDRDDVPALLEQTRRVLPVFA